MTSTDNVSAETDWTAMSSLASADTGPYGGEADMPTH